MAYIFMLKQLWRLAEEDRNKIIIYFICHIISLLGILLQPFAFAMVINSLQVNNAGLIKEVITWLVIYVCLFVAFNIFHRIGRFIEQRVAFRARQRFINQSYGQILGISIDWHTNHHSGGTINRVKVAAEAMYKFGELQFQYIENFMMFWGPIVALFILSWQIALAAFLISILTIRIIGYFDKILVPLFTAENDTQHAFMSVFFDYISNIRTIITLRLNKKTEEELNAKIESAYPVLTKSISVNQAKWAIVSFCILVLEIGIILYYIFSTKTQSNSIISIGYVVAIFQYLQQLSRMFFSIAANYQDIVHMKTNFKACELITEEFIKEQDKKNSSPLNQAIQSWSKISIRGLSFSYVYPSRILFENINIDLLPESKIALIGESGSGKSTILSMLRGLYDATTVNLCIDDKAYNNLSPLSDITTLILQDPEIFENTIEFNITLGENIPNEIIMSAIETAGFKKVLDKLPHGLQTDIRERGVNLSGGEKQRLALARGLLAARNSSIVLLDEPTSSIDIHNELLIYKHIFTEFNSKCVISSVHRLHLLDMFDKIYVFSNGKIVQEGNLSQLQNQSGLFIELWQKYRKSKVHEK